MAASPPHIAKTWVALATAWPLVCGSAAHAAPLVASQHLGVVSGTPVAGGRPRVQVTRALHDPVVFSADKEHGSPLPTHLVIEHARLQTAERHRMTLTTLATFAPPAAGGPPPVARVTWLLGVFVDGKPAPITALPAMHNGVAIDLPPAEGHVELRALAPLELVFRPGARGDVSTQLHVIGYVASSAGASPEALPTPLPRLSNNRQRR